MKIDFEKEQIRAELLGSLLEFTKTFYPLLTSRDFIIPNPSSREPHVITICRELTRAFRLELTDARTIINVPPGHGKSTLLSMFVAWAMAHYPDSNFLYISYGKTLATKHTEIIKRIMSLSHYKYLFDVHIRSDSTAKDLFTTTAGGVVCSLGATGSVVGQNAGLPPTDPPRFTGCVIIDDPHKPDEVTSDTMRQAVIDNYQNTIMQRPRDMLRVPIIFIGQRLHEADLAAFLLDGEDGRYWDRVILKSIDESGNALYPEAFPLDKLQLMQEHQPYEFAAQHQQNPNPPGAGLFRREMFVILSEIPKIVKTFITVDSAETQMTYNDATVFTFWGVYEIEIMGRKTGQIGLHCLDCWELRCEPKDLKDNFLSFYSDCLRFPVPPYEAAIEKKSTGTTLVSVLSDMRGLKITGITRDVSDKSKTQRYLDMQQYIAAKLISFSEGAKHADMCITHMCKITANQTHRHDDICDTFYDAIHIALIKKQMLIITPAQSNQNAVLNTVTQQIQRQQQLRTARNATTNY